MSDSKDISVVSSDPAEQGRLAVLVRFQLEAIQHLTQQDLLLAQSLAGHGDAWGIWQTSDTLARYLKRCIRYIDLAKRIHAQMGDELGDSPAVQSLVNEGVMLLTRLALLMRLAPGKGKKKRLKSSTLAKVTIYQYWPVLIARAIRRKVERPDAKGLLNLLTEDDVEELRRDQRLAIELDRLSLFAARGLWNDLPPLPNITLTTNPKGKKQAQAQREPQEFQPIPDDYLMEIGPRVLWLVMDLTPHLQNLLGAVAEYLVGINWSLAERRTISTNVERFVARYLHKHPWVDRRGIPVAPPFPLSIGTGRGASLGRTVNREEWPPRTWEQLKILSATCQSAHLFITLLTCAARIGEVITLQRDCVSIERDGLDYLNGWTYKLSGNLFGDQRQWPAPEVLVQSLGQQARLAAIWGRLPNSLTEGLPSAPLTQHALWLSLGVSSTAKADKPLESAVKALMKFAERVGMDPKPGGINLHPHRFRKTIGRLAGIALHNSPLVLKRLFGHKSIEMTLHYILTEEAIREEAETVLRELRIMNCAEALEEIHEALASGAPLPGHGGAPAARLVDAVQEHEKRLAHSGRLWTEGSAYDLAYLITTNGKGWRFIQKNVVCTKVSGEGGLCQKKRNRGEPDTSNCKVECSNRLVLHWERRNAMDAADCHIDVARKAKEDEQFMVLFESMQRFNEVLETWPDLKAKYLGDPEVQDLLACCEEFA